MITMTSLQAQNSFGEMLDTSQREPVLITRCGRLAAMLVSPNGDPRRAVRAFINALGEISPLADKDVLTEFNRVLAPIDAHNQGIALTEEDVTRLIDAQ
jgi:hypothetical protein